MSALCQQATYVSWLDHATACGLSHLLQWHDGGDVNFDQHAGPSKLANGQERVSWHRCRPERVLPALTEIGLISDVGHISDHLHDIAKCGPVLFERALDLVECVLALRCEVALDYQSLGRTCSNGSSAILSRPSKLWCK